MAMATSHTEVQHLTDQPSHHRKAKVYLLFKEINQSVYTKNSRFCHWQVVCYFKDTAKYVCCELQTDNNKINGNITYNISDFSYDETIYYYYIGKCVVSELELKNKCQQIMINQSQYILGFRDCQTWATLLIRSLGLYTDTSIPIQVKQVFGTLYPITWLNRLLKTSILDNISRPGDAVINYVPIFSILYSQMKNCNGHENLEPTKKKSLSA
ncbi:unnamed protein product, partial [Adineta steineri]